MGDKESVANKPAGKPAGKPGVGTAAAAAFSAGNPGASAPVGKGKFGKPKFAAAESQPPKKAQRPAQGGNAASARNNPGKPSAKGGAQGWEAPMLPVANSRAAASNPAPLPRKATWKCKHCGGGSFHLVTGCRVFQEADVPGRHVLMADGGHCYVCFKRGHKREDCADEMASCDICHKRHHTLLHRFKKEESTS